MKRYFLISWAITTAVLCFITFLSQKEFGWRLSTMYVAFFINAIFTMILALGILWGMKKVSERKQSLPPKTIAEIKAYFKRVRFINQVSTANVFGYLSNFFAYDEIKDLEMPSGYSEYFDTVGFEDFVRWFKGEA